MKTDKVFDNVYKKVLRLAYEEIRKLKWGKGNKVNLNKKDK